MLALDNLTTRSPPCAEVAAASSMARKLGETAQLNANDRLLDVGFGFAEQDLFWVQEFSVAHITGVNITMDGGSVPVVA